MTASILLDVYKRQIIDSYNKLCEKYQIKNEPFLKLQGMVVTTFAEEGKPELDLRKNHKLLLVSTGAKDVSNQIFWVLYEFSPNVFYVLNDKLVASDPLKTEDYKELLSMPEVRKRIYFPEADMKNLMFEMCIRDRLSCKELLHLMI